MMFSGLLAADLGPLGYIFGRIGQVADFLEDRNGYNYSNGIVLPDPLVGEVVLPWKLHEFRCEGVRELHGPADLCCFVCHCDIGIIYKRKTENYVIILLVFDQEVSN